MFGDGRTDTRAMGTSYRPYHPEQPFLLPPSPQQWLPENHLAYFIADTLRQIDLRPLHQRYEGDGRRNQPYHPVMMLTLLVYAYATGVFSSRKIARKIDEDVAFRVPRRRQPSRLSHPQSLSSRTSRAVQKAVRRGRATRQTNGLAEAGDGGARRHESESQRLQTQGHELPTPGGRRRAFGGGGATSDRTRRTNRRRRGQAVRRGERRRDPRGIASTGKPHREDPRSQGGAGSRAGDGGPGPGTLSRRRSRGGRREGRQEGVRGTSGNSASRSRKRNATSATPTARS